MAEATRVGSGGIVIPVETQLDKLKADLRAMKREIASVEKEAVIKPKVALDERMIEKEATKLTRTMERQWAQVQARIRTFGEDYDTASARIYGAPRAPGNVLSRMDSLARSGLIVAGVAAAAKGVSMVSNIATAAQGMEGTYGVENARARMETLQGWQGIPAIGSLIKAFAELTGYTQRLSGTIAAYESSAATSARRMSLLQGGASAVMGQHTQERLALEGKVWVRGMMLQDQLAPRGAEALEDLYKTQQAELQYAKDQEEARRYQMNAVWYGGELTNQGRRYAGARESLRYQQLARKYNAAPWERPMVLNENTAQMQAFDLQQGLQMSEARQGLQMRGIIGELQARTIGQSPLASGAIQAVAGKLSELRLADKDLSGETRTALLAELQGMRAGLMVRGGGQAIVGGNMMRMGDQYGITPYAKDRNAALAAIDAGIGQLRSPMSSKVIPGSAAEVNDNRGLEYLRIIAEGIGRLAGNPTGMGGGAYLPN